LSWVRALTSLDEADFRFETAFPDQIFGLPGRNRRRISARSASDGTPHFLAVAVALLSPDTLLPQLADQT